MELDESFLKKQIQRISDYVTVYTSTYKKSGLVRGFDGERSYVYIYIGSAITLLLQERIKIG